ncbi:DUF397 domain-containing protein [Nocardiopsis sp. Huas11]|uniref:DUF397 domain-containing protein n=1 Tax=Nocardiopsis sp. Huas11 TaxID=2183912 RepID=UPI000EAB9966|nr:DUF397 domain-containing protein [Nocardiopsis sp. Huas11]
MNEPAWHTSTYTDGRGGNCVEVAEGPMTRIRDTKNRDLGHLDVPAEEWTAVVTALRG